MGLRMQNRAAELDMLGGEIAEELMEKGEEGKGDEAFSGHKRVALLMQDGVPWSQMENEPIQWYERFVIYYLTLDSGERSIAGTYNAFSGQHVRSAPAAWYKARDKFDWENRAIAYDEARTVQRKQLIEDVDVAIEDEIKNSLLTALRAAVQKVESSPDELDIKTAINAIPRLAKEIQDVYGVGKRIGIAKNIEDLLKGLPKSLTQKVMIYIDKSQQGELPGNMRGQIAGNTNVIDAEFVEEASMVGIPAKAKKSKKLV